MKQLVVGLKEWYLRVFLVLAFVSVIFITQGPRVIQWSQRIFLNVSILYPPIVVSNTLNGSTKESTLSLINIVTSIPTNTNNSTLALEIASVNISLYNGDLTLISAFFDIGDHNKGGGKRRTAEYFQWCEAFGHIWTRLLFYTDSPSFGAHLRKVRSRLPPDLTHIFQINRSSLWSFQMKDVIAVLYADARYPKHHPNTVVPEYSCSMHSKFACLQDAILNRNELSTTPYYSWIDIGYFRDLNDGREYCIDSPSGLKKDKVMYNQVYHPNFDLSPKDIYYGNHVWVGGGMFVATRDTMLSFCSEYRRATEFLLFNRNLSSTDQQCLYASFTKEGRRDINLKVELQIFEGNGDWFKLGFSCLRRIN